MNHPKDLASEIEAQFTPKVNQNGELLRDSAAAARMRVLEEERNAAVLEAERARKERDCAMAREKVALERPVCEYRARFHDECRRTAEQVETWIIERDRLKAERDRLKAELNETRTDWNRAVASHARTSEAYRLTCLERDRLKAALEDVQARVAGWGAWASRALALENELNKTRAEWRDAVRATAEAKNMLTDLEVSAQEADREAADRESGLLGELAEVKDAHARTTEAHRLTCLLLDNERADHEVTREALVLTGGVVGDLLTGAHGGRTREAALNVLLARINGAMADAAAKDATAKGEP